MKGRVRVSAVVPVLVLACAGDSWPKGGAVGVMIGLLGSKAGAGPGAIVTPDNDGKRLEALPAPNRPDDPGYMYDVGVKPELNRMITSSWTHPHHFRGNPVAPENVGDAVVVWDWKASKGLQVEHLEKMPLEVGWMHGPSARGGCFHLALAWLCAG